MIADRVGIEPTLRGPGAHAARRGRAARCRCPHARRCTSPTPPAADPLVIASRPWSRIAVLWYDGSGRQPMSRYAPAPPLRQLLVRARADHARRQVAHHRERRDVRRDADRTGRLIDYLGLIPESSIERGWIWQLGHLHVPARRRRSTSCSTCSASGCSASSSSGCGARGSSCGTTPSPASAAA